MELVDAALPALRPLIDPDAPLATRALSAVDGITVGRAVVDDPKSPLWCVLVADSLFVGGSPSDREFCEAFELLLGQEINVLDWPSSPAPWPLPPAPESRDLVFDRLVDFQGVDALIDSTPADCAIRPIGADLADRLAWRQTMVEGAFGGVEPFLEHGLGLALMRGAEILSESYGTSRADGVVELGIVTHEAHRRQGYGAMASAHMVRLCASRDLETFWHCAADNLGSAAIARRLGYTRERSLRRRWYQKARP
jgi:GNAT superfamily N-acetyltransferase